MLPSTELGPRPILPRGQGKRDLSSTSSSMAKRRAILQLQSNRIQSLRTRESNHRSSRRRRNTWQITEPGPMRTTGELTLSQRRRKRPGEVHKNRVVVREYIAQILGVSVCELLAGIDEAVCLERHNVGPPVQHFIDRLACLNRRRILAYQGIRPSSGIDTIFLKLDPGVCEGILRLEDSNGRIFGARVATVRIAHDYDGVTGRPGVDVICDLLQVGVTGSFVFILGAWRESVMRSITT